MTELPERIEPKSPRQRADDFLERVNKLLDEMSLSEPHKKTILDLLEIELKYPTTEKDAISSYKRIIEINMK